LRNAARSDEFWEKLSRVEKESQCGLALKTNMVCHGKSFHSFIQDAERQRSQKAKRVMEAMLQMKKIDIPNSEAGV